MVVQVVMGSFRGVAKVSPKVLAVLGSVAAAGVAVGAKGVVDLTRSGSIRRDAKGRFDEAVAECERVRRESAEIARLYGEFQLGVHRDTVARFADWLEQNEHLVKRLNFKRVDGVRIRVPDIPTYKAGVENVTAGVAGLVTAMGAAASAQAGALWGVATFASASTGTAISSLSGAAAQNATLAWLGGGSLASGGGGITAGSAVLGLVTVVPVLLIGGMTIGIHGTRTKTRARRYAAEIELEIRRISVAQQLLSATQQRIAEMRDVLVRLVERATSALDALEAHEFDPNLHAREFLRVLQLATAVKEVLNTPILDPKSGELTEASIEVVRSYT